MTTIDLITGILGAGKTTFLLRYARYFLNRGERIAILVNDFGAVNVDLLLLKELAGEQCEIVTICGCGDPNAHRRRYKTQLTALGMQHFDRVIIEPSGIFDMDEFFDPLYEPPLDRWFSVGSILTIIDAGMEDDLGEQMEFLLGSEAAGAGRLIVSKLSAVPREARSELPERLLAHVNRTLRELKSDRQFREEELFIKEWDTLTEDEFEMLSHAGYRSASYVKRFNAQTIRSSVHYFMHICIPEMQIEGTIRAVMEDVGCGHIYRIKGSLPTANGWCKINATREATEISPVTDGQAVLIVIGDALDREQIDLHFKAVNTDPEYVSV